MDYEKEYKRKALEPIVNYIESVMASYSKEELEARILKALPKKESEDERIRKYIVKFVELEKGVNLPPDDADKMLAFLERQKEQKPVTIVRIPKFRVGDIIQHVPLEKWDSTKKITSIDEHGYNYNLSHLGDTVSGGAIGFAFEDEYELAEQKPAESDSIKGGDFISDRKRVFLVLANVKERNLGEAGSAYCESLILGVDGVVYCNGDDFKKYKRATSDERAKFIHDLKVGVKLKEQPAEWSKEDERLLSKLESYVDLECFDRECNGEDLRKWLKSLRLQPHWKPSEQEKGALRTAISILTDERNFPKAAAQLQNILDVFEGKEPRKYWKPSKEQMKALNAVANEGVLLDLFNDLLKLFSL